MRIEIGLKTYEKMKNCFFHEGSLREGYSVNWNSGGYGCAEITMPDEDWNIFQELCMEEDVPYGRIIP